MPESPPQVNAFLLCDQAFQQAFTGKWCVIGTFGVIWAREFPVTHAPMVVFIGLSDFKGDTEVEVQILDGSGGRVAGIKAQIPPVPSPVAEFAMPFPPIKFDQAGSYTMELSAGGQLLAARSFRVQQAPQQPPQWPVQGGPPPGMVEPPPPAEQ